MEHHGFPPVKLAEVAAPGSLHDKVALATTWLYLLNDLLRFHVWTSRQPSDEHGLTQKRRLWSFRRGIGHVAALRPVAPPPPQATGPPPPENDTDMPEKLPGIEAA